jgi:hypothetical protein
MLLKEKFKLLSNHIIKNYPNVDKDSIDHKISLILNLKETHNGGTILDVIKSKKLVINVIKNSFSNYVLDAPFEDIKNAKLVMDLTTKEVIGFENLKGEIESLNKNLIDLCHKYKIKYRIPFNLNFDSESDIEALDQDLKLYLLSDEDDEE